jgi:hypothetical protein
MGSLLMDACCNETLHTPWIARQLQGIKWYCDIRLCITLRHRQIRSLLLMYQQGLQDSIAQQLNVDLIAAIEVNNNNSAQRA